MSWEMLEITIFNILSSKHLYFDFEIALRSSSDARCRSRHHSPFCVKPKICTCVSARTKFGRFDYFSRKMDSSELDSSSELYDQFFDFAYRQLLEHLHAAERMERAKPEVKSYYDLLNSAKGVRIWKYLKLLLRCLHQCSNANEVLQNWKSGLDKTEAAVNEIAVHLRYLFDYMVFYGDGTMPKRFMEDFDKLCVSEENICTLFKVEIGESMEYLSRTPFELKWNHPLPTFGLCHELLVCVQQSVECIIHQSLIYLPRLGIDRRMAARRFLAVVNPLLDFLWNIRQENAQSESDFVPNDDIVNFLNHLASVAVRTVNQCLSYWVNKKVDPQLKIVGFQELQDEIDLVSSHFLQLIVKFLKALQKIKPGNFAPSFARYILHPSKYISPDAKIFIETLLAFFINESEEGPYHSLLSEIEQMLILLVFYTKNLSYLSYPELHTRICLLNEEVLLRQQMNSCSTISLGNQVEELNEFLKFLEKFSDHRQTKKNGNVERTSVFVHELVSEVASLYQSFDEKKIKKQMMQIPLFKLLLKIVLFKADISSTELFKFLDSNEGMKSIGKDESERIFEGLNFFRAFVTNLQDELTEKNAELILARIEESARGITTLCYSLEFGTITQEMIENVILSFSSLLDRMTVLKSECRELCCTNPTSSTFPRVDGLDFIDFLLENLQELLKLSHVPVALVKDHIERFGLELEVTRSFLMKLDTEDPEMVNLARRVTEAAYEGEYIIELIEVGNSDCWQTLWLCDVIRNIRLLNSQATNLCQNRSDAEGHNIGQASSQRISRAHMPEIGDFVVCISEDEEIVIDQLTRGSSQRDLISIVGMPGIGKTTLAKKMYNDPRVTFHFHVRAWCSVSQVFTKRELLLEILCDIAIGFAEKGDILQMTDDDLALKLYQCLKGRRYLIVLDDVWDTEAWNSLERSFPNDENRSRVMMTSRLHDVAAKVKPHSNPHELRLFNDDESWTLLQMKIFQGGCPEELLEAGKEIAKNCRGLPLAIVAIAGILEKTERTKDSWRKIAASLTTQIIDDPQTRCMDILQMSYNHLPSHLKACFLYFASFFVHKDIPVCKLIRLWIAEGFIRKIEIKSVEDLAEDYLLDLIGRSLVTASRKGSDGRVKACRMHDLLHDLCLSKAKEENFLQLITGCDMPYASFSDLDFGDDYLDYYTINPVKYEKYRVHLFLNRKQFVKSSPFGPGTRSLIFSATSDQYPRCPYDISFISTSFKLLRVLDLENINMGTSFPTGIESLVLLRYLAVSGDIDLIPSSISKLQKLETFVVKGLKGKVLLPDSIWCMGRLRHLHVHNHVDFNFDDANLESFLRLVNLVSFSSPSLAYGKEKILRRLPNLCKLKCRFLESLDASTNYNKFPVLDFLDQLESLKILYIGRSLNPSELILPMNLKKLTLSNLRLPWTHISAIGGLENLEVLKLLWRAFEGKIWNMNEGEFHKLKYLKLDRLNIVQWNASSDHLPNLQQLVLRNCEALEEVPYTFGEIPTILRIEVQSCGQSTEESVRNIGELGIEGLEIYINQKIHI